MIGLHRVWATLIKLMGFGGDPHGYNQISPHVSQPPYYVSSGLWSHMLRSSCLLWPTTVLSLPVQKYNCPVSASIGVWWGEFLPWCLSFLPCCTDTRIYTLKIGLLIDWVQVTKVILFATSKIQKIFRWSWFWCSNTIRPYFCLYTVLKLNVLLSFNLGH